MNTIQKKSHPDLLSAELQQSAALLQDKKARWLAESEKEKNAAAQLETLRQRQQQTITDYERMKNARSALLFDSNGENTPEVKRLRAEMVEQRETADDLQELIALREAELVTLPWKTGDAAYGYVTSHRHMVEEHINTLLDTELAESCNVLFSLLKIKYQYLHKSHSEHVRGITSGVNDADTLFKGFITATFFDRVIRMDNVSVDDSFIAEVRLWPEDQAVQDAGKCPTPAQRHKYEMANKARVSECIPVTNMHPDDEFSRRSDNLHIL